MKAGQTEFSGLAGEVVRGFLSLSVWPTLVPVYFLWAFVALILYMAGQFIPPQALTPLSLCIGILIAGYIVGRFAIPAARSDVNSPFFSEELEPGDPIFFSLRGFLFLLIWEVPLYLLSQIPQVSFSPFTVVNPTSLINAGFVTYISYLITILMLLGPTVAWLLASCTNDFAQVTSSAPWKWLFQARRRDLPAFYSSALGGWLCFLAIYLVPIAIVVGVILSIGFSSPPKGEFNFQAIQTAMYASLMVFLIPAAAAPVLIGRLSGAFVQGYGSLDSQAEVVTLDQLEQAESDPTAAAVPSETETAPLPISEELAFVPSEVDPSDATVEWIRENLNDKPAILSSYLIGSRNGEDGVISDLIALELDPDTPLGKRQKVIKTISSLQSPVPVIFINLENREAILAGGLMLYKRK